MNIVSPVLDTAPLGLHWPTVDPFLFCAHHRDEYPAGTATFGPPPASLAGRNIGSDFEPREGWRMYHGQTVPGFPQHPHRGFETVTFVRSGFIDHADSLGATARFGAGDAQWLTAGRGIVHAEMFPLLDPTKPNPAELFQIWLNLPKVDKMVEPYFTMLWADPLQRHIAIDDAGRATEITVIAGRFGDAVTVAPPPDSWAGRDDSDVGIWEVHLSPSARWVLPKAHAGTTRMLYFFEGSSLVVGGHRLNSETGALLRCDADAVVEADAGGASCLVLQGRPIGEPVAQYGPFVMNDQAGIEQAFADYRRTGFGGWPWSADDPINGPSPTRFARHPGGREERPA